MSLQGGKTMAKRGLKTKVPGREPNVPCICGSGIKYKKCCGKGQKSVGKYQRPSAKRQKIKVTDEDINKTMDMTTFAWLQTVMARRRNKIIPDNIK